MSIRLRLLLLVFAVWVPAVLAFGVIARSTYQREAEGALQDLQQLGESLHAVVESELDKRAVLARTLAADLEVGEGSAKEFHTKATAATRDSASWAVLIDRTTILANTLLPIGESRASPRVSSRYVTGAPEAYVYRQSPILKRPVMALLAAAPGLSSPRFNVVVGFEPAAVQGVVDQLRYPEGSVAAVLDKEQVLIARSRDPLKWFGRQATGDIGKRAQAGLPGIVESITLDGIPSFTYLSEADRYGWTVAIALPRAALTSAARMLTLRFVAASGLLLLIGLGLALYAARRISEPLLALGSAADQLGEDAVPPKLFTGVSEVDDVSAAIYGAGLRAWRAATTLEMRVDMQVNEAVQKAEVAQARVLEARKHEAIGRLTGGLAHDFNNLLQTISTGLQLLNTTTEEGPQRRVLEAAMRANTKAAALVRQMLTFGRHESLQPKTVDLGVCILKTRDLASKAAGGRVQITASVESGLPLLLLDPTQLEVATLNLVFNASQSMPAGGSILIVARRARDDETASLGTDRYVCLEVSDDGAGMSPEVLAKAFEPYFTTKPPGAGSGMGLPQVLSFALQSGGDVRLQSTPGTGTRACLFLPSPEDPTTQHGRNAME